MQLTPKIEEAINKAAALHLGQVRKGDGLPYIIHPFAVAILLSSYTTDENVIIAALLHDTLEDVKDYCFEDLAKEFGPHVAKIVKEVSEDKDPEDPPEKKKATWEKRKRTYIENLKNDSQEALIVSCADKIHNLRSMIAAYQDQGEKLWKKFNSPPNKRLWFYQEVAKVLKSRLNNPITRALDQEIENMGRLMSGVTPSLVRDRSYYINLRDRYKPRKIGVIFILESPPASGRYFYDLEGTTGETLFSGMMEVMNYEPKSKADGLAEFKRREYFLLDATYKPVNDVKNKFRRNALILRDLPNLLDDLKAVTRNRKIRIVLIKANICRLLEAPLKEAGYNVINNGLVIPFPGSGHQKEFLKAIRKIL